MQVAAVTVVFVSGCGPEREPEVVAVEVPEARVGEAEITPAEGVHTQSAIYFFNEAARDILSANAYDTRKPVHTDAAYMEYTLVVDGDMYAKLADVQFEGGTVELQFTLREGFSFVGAGSGFFSGSVVATAGSMDLIQPIVVFRDGPSGTVDTTYKFDVAPALTEHLEVGDTIRVTLTGVGTAQSNGVGYIDQSIVSWYFKASGKPMLKAFVPL